MLPKLIIHIINVFAATGEGFELFDTHNMEYIITVRNDRLFLQSSAVAAKEGIERAYFRPQGSKILVDKAPICAREMQPGIHNIEICKFNEPDDTWKVKELDNEGHIVLKSSTGERCIGYGPIVKGLENMLFSVKCDDTDMTVVFYSVTRYGVFNESSSADEQFDNAWTGGGVNGGGIGLGSGFGVGEGGAFGGGSGFENLKGWKSSGHNWPGNTFVSSFSHKNNRHHHVEHVRTPYFRPTHVHNY